MTHGSAKATETAAEDSGEHLYLLLKSAAREAKDLSESLVKQSEILLKESELKIDASVGSSSSAYRVLLLETEADTVAREAILRLENCRRYLSLQTSRRSLQSMNPVRLREKSQPQETLTERLDPSLFASSKAGHSGTRPPYVSAHVGGFHDNSGEAYSESAIRSDSYDTKKWGSPNCGESPHPLPEQIMQIEKLGNREDKTSYDEQSHAGRFHSFAFSNSNRNDSSHDGGSALLKRIKASLEQNESPPAVAPGPGQWLSNRNSLPQKTGSPTSPNIFAAEGGKVALREQSLPKTSIFSFPASQHPPPEPTQPSASAMASEFMLHRQMQFPATFVAQHGPPDWSKFSSTVKQSVNSEAHAADQGKSLELQPAKPAAGSPSAFDDTREPAAKSSPSLHVTPASPLGNGMSKASPEEVRSLASAEDKLALQPNADVSASLAKQPRAIGDPSLNMCGIVNGNSNSLLNANIMAHSNSASIGNEEGGNRKSVSDSDNSQNQFDKLNSPSKVKKVQSKVIPGHKRMERRTEIVDSAEDGWNWRKYGQKETLNNSHPRSYYRCSQRCGAKKQVERCRNDPTKLQVMYEGEHNHEKPKMNSSKTAAMVEEMETLLGAQMERLNSSRSLSNAMNEFSQNLGQFEAAEGGNGTSSGFQPLMRETSRTWVASDAVEPSGVNRALPPLPSTIAQAFGDIMKTDHKGGNSEQPPGTAGLMTVSVSSITPGNKGKEAAAGAGATGGGSRGNGEQEKANGMVEKLPSNGNMMEDLHLDLMSGSSGLNRKPEELQVTVAEQDGGNSNSSAVAGWKNPDEQDTSTPHIHIGLKGQYLDEKISPTFIDCFNSPLCSLSSPFIRSSLFISSKEPENDNQQ